MKLLCDENRAVICLTPTAVAVCLRLTKTTPGSVLTWHMPTGSDGEPVALAREAVAWLCEQSGGQFVDVRLFLSDYWIQHRVLELSNLPRDPATQDELILWRMAQELGMAEGALSAAWQCVGAGSDAGHCLVYATAMDYELHRGLVAAVREAGCRLSHLGSLCHGILDGKPLDVEDAVIAWIAFDHWLTLRIGQGGLTAVRAQRGTGNEAVAALRRDLARAVTEQGLKRLHVLSDGDRIEAASQIVTSLAGTVPDLRTQVEVAVEPGAAPGHPELLRLAALLGAAA